MEVKVILHPLFVAIIIFAFWFGYGFVMLAILGAVVFHELGHLWAARWFGVKTREMRLLPFGAEVNIDCAFIDNDKKILILLAGPLANIIVVIIGCALLWLFPIYFGFIEIFVIANAIPAVLNLLPIYPLDGGKILSLILPGRHTKIIVFVTNILFGALAIVAGLWLINIPLLIFAIVILLSINFEFKTSLLTSKIKSISKNNVGSVHEVSINSQLTLFQVYKLVHGSKYTKFVVTDMENKVLYESDLESYIVNHSANLSIAKILLSRKCD